MSVKPYDPLKVGTPEEIATKRLLLENPDIFIEYYSRGSAVPIVLDDYQKEMLTHVAVEPRLVLLLPAGHGKSTIAAKWYIIWRICQNPNIRIILVMKNDKEVGMYASSIRRELQNNRLLLRDFGPFQPRTKDARWSNEAIEVFHRQITETQPTVEFASSNSIEQVLGHRCDEYIMDDIVTPKTVNTQDLRDQQDTTFSLGIDTGPQFLWNVDKHGEWTTKPDSIYWPDDLRPLGRKIVYKKGLLMGTVFDPDDLFHRKGRTPQDLVPGRLYEGNTYPWKVLYYDCWKHDKDNAPTDEPLMPSRWTAQELHAKERSGAIDFAKRYRNIAIDEAHVAFKRRWIVGGEEFPGCLDDTRSVGDLPNQPDAEWRITVGLDPGSGRKGETYSAATYVVLAADMKAEVKVRYVLDCYRQQMGYEDILSWLLGGDPRAGIEGLWNRYHYDIAVIEKNAAQNRLLESPRLKGFCLDHSISTVGWETQAPNIRDAVMGVTSMQSMFQNGLIKIPWAKPSDREHFQLFIEQTQMYPAGFKDYPMALWFANLGIKDEKSHFRAWGGSGRRYVRDDRGWRIGNGGQRHTAAVAYQDGPR